MSIIDLNQFSSIISIANGNQLIMISDTFELSIGNIESLTYCNYFFSSQKEICCSIAAFSLNESKTQEILIKSVL